MQQTTYLSTMLCNGVVFEEFDVENWINILSESGSSVSDLIQISEKESLPKVRTLHINLYLV